MATFHSFPRLPVELLIQIWESTVEPRAVDVRVKMKHWNQDHSINNLPPSKRLVSSTPAPASLHTCREARYQGLYQQAFSELAASDGSGRRYVWVNLDIDIICIGTVYTTYYKPVAPLIQRLQLESIEAIFIDHWRDSELHDFVNLKEMYLNCADGMWTWYGQMKDIHWPCGEENVFMIDPDDGRMIRGVEMDRIFAQETEEAYNRAHERGGLIQTRDSKELIPLTKIWMGELPQVLSDNQMGESGPWCGGNY